MEHSPGSTTGWATKQALVNLSKLKLYQASFLTMCYEIRNKLQEKTLFKKKNTNRWRLNKTSLNNQYSCLENPLDGGAWWAAVHGVAKSQTRLSDFTFTFHFHALEKEMATHSSVLVWSIPGMEEPGGLPSMGSHRVGYDWSDLAAAAANS